MGRKRYSAEQIINMLRESSNTGLKITNRINNILLKMFFNPPGIAPIKPDTHQPWLSEDDSIF